MPNNARASTKRNKSKGRFAKLPMDALKVSPMGKKQEYSKEKDMKMVLGEYIDGFKSSIISLNNKAETLGTIIIHAE